MDQQEPAAQPISFDDLGGKQVAPAPNVAAPPAPSTAPNGIDFSDLGGKRVSLVSPTPAPSNDPAASSMATNKIATVNAARQAAGVQPLPPPVSPDTGVADS